MKSTIGLLSDSLPLFGYHKRSYIVIFSILGALSLLSLSILPTTSHSFGMAAALLFTLVNLQVAAVDLLTEAKYAQLMVSKPETGSDLVSFSQGSYAIGGFIASLLTAPLTLINPRYTFIICLPLAAHVIIPCILPDTSVLSFPEKLLSSNLRHFRIDKYHTYPSLFKLSFAISIMSIMLAVLTFTIPDLEFLASGIASVVLITATLFWLPPTLRMVNLYLFLNNALYVPISGAMHYFFTADEKCLPNGPQFSLPFYLSLGSMVTQLAYFIGAIAFQMFFAKGYMRKIVLITNTIKIISALFDIAIVTRVNKYFGIPDSVVFLFGDAVVYHVTYRLELIPLIVLTSKVCPRGMEASVYALLVSFQNFGGSVGQSIGYVFMQWFRIRTVPPCDFSGLPGLVFVARIVMPALTLPLVYWLIPDVKLTDDFMQEDGDDEFRAVRLTTTTAVDGISGFRDTNIEDDEEQISRAENSLSDSNGDDVDVDVDERSGLRQTSAARSGSTYGEDRTMSS